MAILAVLGFLGCQQAEQQRAAAQGTKMGTTLRYVERSDRGAIFELLNGPDHPIELTGSKDTEGRLLPVARQTRLECQYKDAPDHWASAESAVDYQTVKTFSVPSGGSQMLLVDLSQKPPAFTRYDRCRLTLTVGTELHIESGVFSIK
jgi:hypothetical protein